MTPEAIDHWIVKLTELNRFLRAMPMTKEFRDTTTYRQFDAIVQAKHEELGLTQAVWAQIRQIQGHHEALDWALFEIEETRDNREMLTENAFYDLPMNYDWDERYEPVQEAVRRYEQRCGSNVTEDEIKKIVLEQVKKRGLNHSFARPSHLKLVKS